MGFDMSKAGSDILEYLSGFLKLDDLETNMLYFVYTLTFSLTIWGLKLAIDLISKKDFDFQERMKDFVFKMLFGLLGIGSLALVDAIFFTAEAEVSNYISEVVVNGKTENTMLEQSNNLSSKMAYVSELTSEINNEGKLVTEQDVKNIEDVKSQMKETSNTLDSPDKYIKTDESTPLWRESAKSILARIIQFITAIVIFIYQFIRVMGLIICKLTFPIVLALSFLPFMENAWKTWIETYISFLLWGIVLTIIYSLSGAFVNIVGNLSQFNTTTGLDYHATVFLLIQVAVGFLTVMSPSITAMIFGVNSAMSQISTQSGMALSVIALSGAKKMTQGILTLTTGGAGAAAGGATGGSAGGAASGSGSIDAGANTL